MSAGALIALAVIVALLVLEVFRELRAYNRALRDRPPGRWPR